jgi:hypothetical protein
VNPLRWLFWWRRKPVVYHRPVAFKIHISK